MERFDLYGGIHKGIRRTLYETAAALAATDFEDPAGCARARAALRRMLGYLDEHARHEDEVILPVLATLAPELFHDLRAEHARVDGLQRELEGLADRLEGASAPERLSLGRRIEDRIGKLVAAQLMHLAREEGDANRILWAHRDDAQLLELQDRIVGGIAPERLSEWYGLAVPAMNPRERRALVADLRASLPAGLFEQVTAGARTELGEPAWRAALEEVPA